MAAHRGMFPGAIIAATLMAIGPSWGEPEAVVEWTPGARTNLCSVPQDVFTLRVVDNGRRILTTNYCSAHGRSMAMVVSDVCGRHYVLLGTSAGPGLEWEDHLTVYRLTDRLVERARMQMTGNANLHARWFYDMRIEKPPEGGLRLVLSLRMEGPDDPDPGLTPTARTRTIRIRERTGCDRGEVS